MNFNDLISKLNEDLSREYHHWHFYMWASYSVTGLHREEYQEFFLKEAADEMHHVQEWAQLIIGVGGIPVKTCPFDVSLPTDVKSLLTYARNMETEVVQNFVERMNQSDLFEIDSNGVACIDFKRCDSNDAAIEMAIDARRIHIFLEDQMTDSRNTVDHINQMLN